MVALENKQTHFTVVTCILRWKSSAKINNFKQKQAEAEVVPSSSLVKFKFLKFS